MYIFSIAFLQLPRSALDFSRQCLQHINTVDIIPTFVSVANEGCWDEARGKASSFNIEL